MLCFFPKDTFRPKRPQLWNKKSSVYPSLLSLTKEGEKKGPSHPFVSSTSQLIDLTSVDMRMTSCVDMARAWGMLGGKKKKNQTACQKACATW